MKSTLLIILLCLSQAAIAQNILSNSGFELYSQCPVNQSQISYCQQWDSAIGTADFYNCGYYAPSTIGPYGIPASGNGCVGLVAAPPYTLNPTYWYGEAISKDLTTTMSPGEEYKVQIDAMINPMNGPGPAIDCYSLGILFVKKGKQLSIPVFGCSNAEPQIRIGINDLQTGTYQTFTRPFVADSCYDRIIIGMFCNANTNSTACLQIGDMRYIDIDNVSMTKTQNAAPVTQGFDCSNTKICEGECISFRDTGNALNYTWEWAFIGASTSQGSQKEEINICYENPGLFDVELITYRECKSDTTLKLNYIEVLESPQVTISSDTTALCTGSIKTLTAESNTDVVWENGQVGLLHQIIEPGLYIAESSNQCGSDYDSLTVYYQHCECSVYLPNSFSPNDDQTNDFYSIYYDCILQERTLTIFNRWGEKVFESDPFERKWDGLVNGKECGEDLYVAILNYKGYSNGLLKQFSIKQTVTLIR